MELRAKFAMLTLSAAVFAGAWLLAALMDEYAVDAVTAADVTAEAAVSSPEPLAIGSRWEFTALSWTRDGETLRLQRDDATGRWLYAADPSCPIDDAAAQTLARAAADVTASVKLTGVTDLGQYGLDPPALTVETATDGAVAVYEIGDTTATNEFYVRRGEDDTVYLAAGSMASAFQAGLYDIMALDSVPADIDRVTGLAVESAAESYGLVLTEGGWIRADDGTALDGDAVAPLTEALTGLDLSDCVSWNAADEGAFGLDRPQAAATVTYADEDGHTREFSLEFGAYEGGSVYVRLAGSALVSLVPASAADAVMYPDWAKLAPVTVFTAEPDELSSVTVELSGVTHEILRLVEETETAEEDGDGAVTLTDVIWSANGWVLEPGDMEAWLASLGALPTEGEAPPDGGRDLLLAVTFRWLEPERADVTGEVRVYDSVHCLCVTDGVGVLVPRADAEALTAAMAELLGGV